MVLIFTVVREDANIGGNGCRVHRTFLYIFFITSCESVFKNEKLGKKKKTKLVHQYTNSVSPLPTAACEPHSATLDSVRLPLVLVHLIDSRF